MDRCDNFIPDDEEVQILSEKHKKVLNNRLKTAIRLITARDMETVRRETPIKLAAIHSSKNFVVKLTLRVKLLYRFLLDNNFPKSRSAEKTIIAGLLYFISPGKFLPDDIPGLGYLDDAYVIKTVCDKVCHELQDYITANGLDETSYL